MRLAEPLVRRLAGLSFAAACGCLAAGAALPVGSTDWMTILDGSNPNTLDTWTRVGQNNWRIEHGVVTADSRVGKESSFLMSKKAYTDFELRAEVWVDANTKSGIYLRGLDPYRIHPRNSYEVNLEDRAIANGYGTGSIVNFAKASAAVKSGGQWNTVEITADHKHLVVVVNGQKTVDMIDSTFAEGPIALEYGGGVVKWRKVQIRTL
jgi:hypothetical protein